MTKRILRAGIPRLVNVYAAALKENLDTCSRGPMVMIRPVSNPDRILIVESAEIDGPSLLAPNFESPLPGTAGRGVCHLLTSARIITYGP